MRSDRQQKAQRLADEISEMGCYIVSPLPLPEGAKLRFGFPSADPVRKGKLILKLRDGGLNPLVVRMSPLQFEIDVSCNKK